MLGFSKKMVEGIFDDVVDFSEIENFIDTQVKFYSSGMYVRLAFAVAVNVDPDILVVDEVLAVGTSASKPSASIESAPFKTRPIDLVRHPQRRPGSRDLRSRDRARRGTHDRRRSHARVTSNLP